MFIQIHEIICAGKRMSELKKIGCNKCHTETKSTPVRWEAGGQDLGSYGIPWVRKNYVSYTDIYGFPGVPLARVIGTHRDALTS